MAFLIQPFAGLRPADGYAEQVTAPPYDVLNFDESCDRAAGKPWSFLHISRPEIDCPEGTSPYDDLVYQTGANNLQKMLDAGVLKQDESPCYYVYRLRMGDHEQIGLVAGASVSAYDQNRVKRHEFTRPAKEDDRVRQIEALNAQTGPVLLTYRNDAIVEDILNNTSTAKPAYVVTADDGVEHALWVIDQEETIEQLTASFDAMSALYIADGHHRSAAASRVAKERNDDYEHYFLTVMFPDHQMRIFDYNRVVKDLNGLDSQEFLDRLSTNFHMTPSDEPLKPSVPGMFGCYLDGQWWQLELMSDRFSDDPVARLDVSLLAYYVLEPLLDITDPRRDSRIDFVGGIRGLEGLEKRVESGEMRLAFSLYPTSLDDLMAVADADKVMPPKSTWFEPKLADGLVSLVL
jgi:uncharacterized protein (DUF1015 family)